MFAIILALALNTNADTILLKNGRSMEGLITAETTNAVTLNVGLGEVRLKKSQIKSVRRSNNAEIERIRAKWSEDYFDRAPFAPKPLAPLIAPFQQLEQQRTSAQQSHRAIAQIARGATNLQSRAESARKTAQTEYNKLQILADPQTRDEWEAYNDQVARVNQAQIAAVAADRAVEETRAALDREQTNIAAYLRSLREFQHQLKMAKTKLASPGSAEAKFIQRVESRLKAYDSEIGIAEVPFSGDGVHAVMDVQINGAKTGRFMMDTGASRVVLSRAFADAINLRVDTNRVVLMTLANGSTEKAYDVTLDTVEAGGMKSHQVPALVMESSPDPGLDGLLGMSFLREFALQYDAAGGRVRLMRYAP